MKKAWVISLAVFFGFQLSYCQAQEMNVKKFKNTRSGLLYRFEERHRRAPQPKVGDVLYGELTLQLDTLTLFTNEGNPARIFEVAATQFPGDINEGLLMMHKGDKAVFMISADTMAAQVGANRMPPDFHPGSGQKIVYTILLHDILTPEEIARQNDSIAADTQRRKEEEPQVLSQYIKEHYTNIEYSTSGLYIYVKQRGYGPVVQPGKEIRVEYVGRRLDGKVFDTSNDSIARQEGIHNPKREYAPLTYIVGRQHLIRGWEEGLLNQPEGTWLTLIMPSSLAYGARGAGSDIPPYTPLLFDIKILSVATPDSDTH